MKKELMLIGLLIAQLGHAQTTLTIQPGAEGKDAYLGSRLPDIPAGDHADFLATAWTYSGAPSNVRSLIEFDLDLIPDGVIIESATLFLYGYDSPSNVGHASLGGDIANHAYLQRITEEWTEATVTWESQPSTTELNQVFLEGTIDENLNYEVDVKTLVEDMLLYPEEGFGFMFRLVTEATYNSLLFASSDNDNAALHPKLVIVYYRNQQTGIAEGIETELSVHPNFYTKILHINCESETALQEISIYSTAGTVIFKESGLGSDFYLNFSNWSPGIYILYLQQGDAILRRKFAIH